MSGFGEGCTYKGSNGGKEKQAIPIGEASNSVRVVEMPDRASLDAGNAMPLLSLDRENRAWLRHQHEVSMDLSTLGGEGTWICKSDITKPISFCSPGGVPFQLNKTPSALTYVTETAIGVGNDGVRHLMAAHPPSLSGRLRGVSQWLAPAKVRTPCTRPMRTACFQPSPTPHHTTPHFHHYPRCVTAC